MAFTRRGATVVTTTGTTWTNTANAVDGAVGSNPGTVATLTSAVSGVAGTIEIGGFDFSALTGSETVTSVQIRVRHAHGNVARWSSTQAVLMDGSTTIGTAQTGTLSTAQHDDLLTSSVIPTFAQLKSATFKVKLTSTKATATSAAWTLDHVEVVVNTPIEKISTFVDTFDTQVDPANWTMLQGTPSWDASGQLAVPSAATTVYSVVRSADMWDAIESKFYAKLTFPMPPGGAAREFYMRLTNNPAAADGTHMAMIFTYQWNTTTWGINFRVRDSGSNTDHSGMVYDPVAMAYLQIRITAGTVYFETSPDGVTWTVRWSRTPSAVTTYAQSYVQFWHGNYQSGGAAGPVYIDNVNTPSATGEALTYSATDSMGLSDAVTPVKTVSPKIETCTDTFDTQIDLNKWAASGTYAWEAGQAKLTPQTPSGYSFLRYKGLYDLNESSFYVKVPGVPTVDTYREAGVNLHTTDATEGAHIYLNISGGVWKIYARDRVASTNSNSSGKIYDPVADKWWKISKTAGTLYFHTSPDGVTWNLLWSKVSTGSHTALEPWFEVGDWQTPTLPVDSVYFDNVNTPEAGQALTYTATDSVGLADLQTDEVQDITTDTLGLTDAITVQTSRALTYSAADAVSLTDLRTDDIGSVTTEAVGLTDSNTTALARALTYSATDIAGLTDAWTLTLGLAQSDAAGVTDTLTLSQGEAFADSTSLSDTVAVTTAKAITDDVSLSDTLSLGQGKAYVDAEGVSDTLALGQAKEFTDAEGLTDLATSNLAKAVQETEALTDVALTALVIDWASTDAVGLTDQATLDLSRALSTALSDTLGLTDQVASDLFRGVTFITSDTASLTDVATYVVTKTYTDAAPLSDEIQYARALVVSFTDTQPITDVETSSLATTWTDSVNITDGVVFTSGLGLAAQDVMGLTDSITVSLARGLDFTDPLSLTDAFILNLTVNLSDPLGLTETTQIGASGAQTFSDLLGLTDSRTFALPFSKTDVGGLTDVITLTMTRTFTDLVGMSDQVSTVHGVVSGRPTLVVNGEWAQKPGMVSLGGVWKEKPWLRWTGTEWKTLK